MKSSMIAGILVAALAGGIGLYFVTQESAPESTSPGDHLTHWICVAEENPYDFTLTVNEVAKVHDVMICSNCGSDEVFRAALCPECSRHIPVSIHESSPANCMHCGTELEGGKFNTFHGQEGH